MDLLINLATLDLIVGNPADQIVDALRIYIGPFVLIFIAIMSIKFIKEQQFMALLSFIVMALAVIIIFYTPGILVSIATAFTGETNLDTSGSAPPAGGGGI